MNKLLLVLTLLFFIPATLLAQNRTITGKVVDESGSPVSGVSVLQNGTKKGTKKEKKWDNDIYKKILNNYMFNKTITKKKNR